MAHLISLPGEFPVKLWKWNAHISTIWSNAAQGSFYTLCPGSLLFPFIQATPHLLCLIPCISPPFLMWECHAESEQAVKVIADAELGKSVFGDHSEKEQRK